MQLLLKGNFRKQFKKVHGKLKSVKGQLNVDVQYHSRITSKEKRQKP